uniref:Ig-like domain-containing protein n=1 Tax=Sphenodon punctatus TaxID=8508 RepID=A0A8D0GFH5_SPHPU
MGSQRHLISAMIIGFIVQSVDSQAPASAEDLTIQMVTKERGVVLRCGTDSVKGNITWQKDGNEMMMEHSNELDLGAPADDPRGVYRCRLTETESWGQPLQVFFRMCQNCIELDAATISGLVVADVVATAFLAVAVYCIAGQDRRRLPRASDKQTLLANEQLYQPLGERDNGQYSRIGVARTQKR